MKLLKQNGMFTAFAVVMLAIGSYLLWTTTQPPEEPVATAAKTPKPPPGDTAQGGHLHADEWHATPYETHETLPAQPISPVETYQPPPDAVTKPVFPEADPNASAVENAYKRLAYIKNNPYAWGGVHSERATELIAQLLPPPVIVDHDHGDEVSALMYELTQQGDPRAAEVFAGLLSPTYEGYMGGDDALVEIGPPALPYVLPYLEIDVAEGGYIRLAVFDILGRIGERYRSDLGGIVDHIIIPKLAEIAADENNERYDNAEVIYAKEALALLGQ